MEKMNRLKFWRQERGLSQYELEAASGVARWVIQLAESGIRNLSPEQVVDVALALGIPRCNLTGDSK